MLLLTQKTFFYSWLHSSQPDINIIVEPEVAEQFQKELPFVHVIEKSKRI